MSAATLRRIDDHQIMPTILDSFPGSPRSRASGTCSCAALKVVPFQLPPDTRPTGGHGSGKTTAMSGRIRPTPPAATLVGRSSAFPLVDAAASPFFVLPSPPAAAKAASLWDRGPPRSLRPPYFPPFFPPFMFVYILACVIAPQLWLVVSVCVYI